MKHQGPPLMVSSKGFYKWAWRIVEGCTNNCGYCYAEMESNDFTKLRFHEDLINEPYKVDPSRIFVNYMGDIMLYDWKIVEQIIDVARDLPNHEFLFMTKLPQHYQCYEFPSNCILGVTIESPEYWYRSDKMKYLQNRKMCSVEPILGDFTGYDFSQFEFVVVGCLMGSDDHSLYHTVKHNSIYYTR